MRKSFNIDMDAKVRELKVNRRAMHKNKRAIRKRTTCLRWQVVLSLIILHQFPVSGK